MKSKEDNMIKSNGGWTPVAEVIDNAVKKKMYDLDVFLQTAKTGDRHEYYQGFLAMDCEKAQGVAVRKLGAYVRNLENRKIICLVQKRIGTELFSYMAVKR